MYSQKKAVSPSTVASARTRLMTCADRTVNEGWRCMNRSSHRRFRVDGVLENDHWFFRRVFNILFPFNRIISLKTGWPWLFITIIHCSGSFSKSPKIGDRLGRFRSSPFDALLARRVRVCLGILRLSNEKRLFIFIGQ